MLRFDTIMLVKRYLLFGCCIAICLLVEDYFLCFCNELCWLFVSPSHYSVLITFVNIPEFSAVAIVVTRRLTCFMLIRSQCCSDGGAAGMFWSDGTESRQRPRKYGDQSEVQRSKQNLRTQWN